jgi:tetratricopeptide (TPR) repeat protein
VPALRRALGMVRDNVGPHRARLLFLLSQAERESGDPGVSAALAREAVAAAEATGDEGLIATARFNLAGMEYDEGNVARAQELHREVLPVFRRLGNRANEARVLSRMALLGAELGEAEALSNSQRAEEILREQGDLAGVAFVLSNRGTLLNRRGEHEQGLLAIEQAERVYRELEDKRMIAMCLGNRSLMNRQLRRFDVAETLVKECSELSRELGDRVTLAKNLMNSGIMYTELGRFSEAEQVLREARDMFTGQNQRLRAVCIEYLALIAGRRGDLAQAQAGFEQALEICENETAPELAAGVQASIAETMIEHGRAKEALEPARAAADYWRAHGEGGRDEFRATASLAQALDQAGDPKAARSAAKQALELAGALNLQDNDPSPFIPPTLKKLRKIRSA